MKKKIAAFLLAASMLSCQSAVYAAEFEGTATQQESEAADEGADVRQESEVTDEGIAAQQGRDTAEENIAAQPGDTASGNIYSVSDFGADGTDLEDDSIAFINALAIAATSDTAITVTVPAGTYYFNRSVPIYSNTNLILDENAVIINNNTDGVMIFSRHLNEDGTFCDGTDTCTHGGYSQIENVTIEGGIWDSNDTAGEGVNLIFQFRHGRNITIRNLTCKNATNHYINVSGVDTALIENVICMDQAIYRGTDPEFWGDYEAGDETRYTTLEAIHIDYLDPGGEARAFPLDGTPSKNITVTGCTFDNVFAGVGTHHYSEQGQNASSIVVDSNTFSNILGYCVNTYGFLDVAVTNNTVQNVKAFVHAMNSSMQVSGNTVSDTMDVGIYFGDSSSGTISGNDISAAPTGIVITQNSTGCTIENNQLSSTADNAIYIYDNSDAEVTGNTITSAGAAAIRAVANCSITANGNIINQPVSHGISVSDRSELTASGNKINGTGSSGIVATDSSALNADYNEISDAGENGIVAMNTVTVNLSNNTVTSPTNNGISLNNGCTGSVLNNQIQSAQNGISVSTQCTDCTISGNTVTSPRENAVYIYDNSTAAVENNTLNEAGASGIKIAANCGVTADRNVIAAPGQHGVYISDSSNAVVRGNEIMSPVSYGIIGTTQSGVEASENTITEAGTVGIYVNDCSSGTISANTVTDPGTHGIYIYSTDGAAVSGNAVSNAGNTGINIYSSGQCAVSDNIVKDCVGNGIQAAGSESKNCSAEILRNTSVSTAEANRDIRLSAYCVDCVVNDNIVGSRGFSADATAQYTASNNTTDANVDLSTCKIRLSESSFDYDGTAKKPEVKVTNTSIILEQDKDYTVEYKNNVELGTASVTVSGIGKYTGTVEKTFSIKLAAPQIQSLTNNGGIEISWNVVPGADGYYVYRRTLDGSWAGVTNISDGTAASFTDTKIAVGTTYYYTVRGYYDNNGTVVNGPYDAVGKSIKAGIPAVTVTKVSSAKGINTVTWIPVDGADGYVVYRRTANGKWTTVSKVADAAASSYADNSAVLTAGEVYYYTVRAYCLAGSAYTYGEYDSVGKSVTSSLSTVVIKNVSSSLGENIVTWNVANGADGYTIYRKTEGGTWNGVGTVEDGQAASFTDSKGLTVGTTYIYTVRAYRIINGVTTYASYDTVGKSVVATLPSVTLQRAVSASGANTIRWSAVSGADGYVVYRKTGSAGWAKLALVSGGDVVTYTDSSAELATGTVYNYTVRAYCLNNGKYTYGGYDSAGLSVEMGLTNPVLKTVTTSAGKNTITWQAVKEADGYVIYRKTAGGSWTGVGTVEGQTCVSFVDSKGLSAGRTYDYTVRAYQEISGKKVYGGYDAAGKSVVASIADVVLTKASTAAGTNTITWTKVPGVSGYVVYRKTNGGSWTKLALVSGDTVTSYTDKSEMTAGTEYYYTVRGYILKNGKYTYGGYDTTGKGVTASLSVVILKSAAAGNGENTISWIPLNGADGYVIYRKTTGGSWASVTTVAGAETSSFTDTKNIASGTQYYYTVRAYMLQGRLKVYGAYDTNGILAQ